MPIVLRDFFALVIAFGLACNFAIAASVQKQKADLDVREIQTVQAGLDVLRAIKGYSEIYPYLIVERIKLPLVEGEKPKLVSSWKLKDMKNGPPLIPTQEGDDITEIKWSDRDLTFRLTTGGTEKRCKISEITSGRPQVDCK